MKQGHNFGLFPGKGGELQGDGLAEHRTGQLRASDRIICWNFDQVTTALSNILRATRNMSTAKAER